MGSQPKEPYPIVLAKGLKSIGLSLQFQDVFIIIIFLSMSRCILYVEALF